jgi:3-methyladenine DNA glycosylase AlkD
MNAQSVMNKLKEYSSDLDATNLQWFFKTGPGQYGEGDQFIGVRVPAIRAVCKEFKHLSIPEVRKLIESPIHEHRMAGLIILTLQYPKSDQKQAIYNLYIDELHKGNVNNWDLVDVTCRAVIGEHLRHDRAKLYELAKSESLWERRVAIVATFPYIWSGDPVTTMNIAELLLHDTHDLIHKAVGWALREVGKRCDEALLIDFLDQHATEMPRTMLRYAIEKLDDSTRAYYLKLR